MRSRSDVTTCPQPGEQDATLVNPSLRIVSVAHQKGRDRYPKADKERRPAIGQWRCNLTALSQYRNLYFVAYLDLLHIFTPEYPSQTIPCKPVGIIKLPQSRPGLVGYVYPTVPQGVNHMVVRDLGDEEILLIACDSGDVIGFTTRSVELSFKRQEDTHHENEPYDLKPFFHENVGDSAWGLDVHKSDRLIAVSSNTHDILIFAFALSSETPDPSFDSYMDNHTYNEFGSSSQQAELSVHWNALTHANDRLCRGQRNFAWNLREHHENIPSVAFYNDSTTPVDDVYLISTDIEGLVKIWSVWARESWPILTDHRRGWAIACLDRSTSRIARSEKETYGCNPKQSEDEQRKLYVDNSECSHGLTDNSQWHPAYSMFSNPPQASPQVNSTDLIQVLAEEDTEAMSDMENEMEEDMATESDEMDIMPNPSNVINFDESESPSLETALDAKARNPRSIDSIPLQSHDLDDRCTLPCNIFITSETNFLLTGTHKLHTYATVCCDQALHQKIPPGLAMLRRIERLNMIHSIDELGLIIVGNQAGRVGILTSTYWPEEKRYGFRVEAILPFKSQEDKDLRPEAPLLGMAISPIQGRQRRAYSPSANTTDQSVSQPLMPERRFRLIMMYYDHTVLSYEFFRATDSGDVLVL